MHYISGEDRNQISVLPPSIDEYVTDENPVRVIDAFVDSLDMTAMGFEHSELNSTGRPPYANQDMLKLYINGYFNRIRSSRCLERETHRNLEVIWLMKNLRPDHKTIARFRHDNPKALNRNVMPLFTKLPFKGLGAIAGKAQTVAFDTVWGLARICLRGRRKPAVVIRRRNWQ